MVANEFFMATAFCNFLLFTSHDSTDGLYKV